MSDILPARAFGQPTGGQRIDLMTGNASYAPMTWEANYSLFGQNADPILGLGYNYGYSGNKPMAGEASMYWMVEGNYDRSSEGINDRVMEQYWEASSADRSISWRPIFVMADKSAANGDRDTFIKSLDLTGPAPSGSGSTAGTGGIRFFSAKDGPGLQSDERTYLFARANLNMDGFSDTNTLVQLGTGQGRNSAVLFGSNGISNVMNVGTDAPNVGHINLAGTQMRLTAINNNKAMSVGINAGGRNTAVLDVDLAGAWSTETGLRVRQQAGGTGNMVSIEDSTGAVKSGFDKSGYIFTQLNAAPANSDLKAGQASFWYDPTPGASKLVVTAKDSGGTVVTGSVSLLPATAVSTAGLTPGAPPYDPVDGANVMSLGSGADTVNGLETRDIMFGNGGADTLYGNGADDLLFGGAGNDTLMGGIGNDTLWGDADADLLTGGTGADIFAFAQTSGADRITDFSTAEGDRLSLNGQSYVTGDDGQGNLMLTLSGGGSVTLQGVAASTTPTSAWFA